MSRKVIKKCPKNHSMCNKKNKKIKTEKDSTVHHKKPFFFKVIVQYVIKMPIKSLYTMS